MIDATHSPSAEPKRQPTLQVSQATVEQGWMARTYHVVNVDIPALSGLACLAMVDQFYQRADTLQRIIASQQVSGQPDTLMSLSRQAEADGYLTRLLHLDNTQLASSFCPAIVTREDGRFAVLFAVSATHVVLADPLAGLQRLSRETFVQAWNGEVLTVAYVPAFRSADRVSDGQWRRFLPIVQSYWPMLAVAGLVSLILQLLGLVSPFFAQLLIDQVLVHADRSLLSLMMLAMLFVIGFKLAASTLREFVMAHVLRRINTVVLTRFFQHILFLPQAIFSRWQIGDFTLRFNENEKLLQLVSQTGMQVIVDSLTILVYLVVMFNKSAALTGVTLLFVAAYAVLLIVTTPILRANNRRIFDRRTHTTSYLVEAVTGIETIKALTAETRFWQQGVGLIVQTKRAQFQEANLTFNMQLANGLIQQVSTVALMGYGAVLTMRHELSTGELVAFYILLGLLIAPLMGLIGVWNKLQEIRIAFERMNDVLVLPTESEDVAETLPEITGHVRFDQVRFRYEGSDTDLLRDVTLEVTPGQKVAFVGRSGSGKTTLAKLVMRLYEPTGGKIFIDERDIALCDLFSLRRQIGVVEQLPFLFDGTVRDNIAKANPTATFERVKEAAQLAGAHEFIEQLEHGYDTVVGENGSALSGGQRQRLIIARALLTNPRILILDEATAALDTESEKIVQKNLDVAMAGRTTFIIAHRLSTVRNADLIVVMDEGQVVEMGTHEQLMAKHGLYHELATRSEA